MAKRLVTVSVCWTQAQAWAFAQFLKRVSLRDFRELASDSDEADEMQDAGEQLRRALQEQAIAPR